MLIIDEGFGALDTAGLDAVHSALTRLSDDYDLVLVVTHLESLREAFPRRLEITRAPGGTSQWHWSEMR